MKKISRRAATQMFVEVPEFSINIPKSGIESLRIMKQVDMLASALDAQANVLDEWREATVQLLLKNLVDEDEGVEVTGDEYEDSTKIQDEVMVYVQALGAVIVDRHDALTGQENNLIEFDVKLSLRLATEGEGPFPEKTIDLLGIRSQIKPPKEMGSIRGFVAELRWLSTSLKTQAQGGNTRAQSELIIVQEQLEIIQKQLSSQSKATAALEKEVSLFTKAMNTRMEYYRQLQQVSDTVAPYEGPADQETMNKFIEEERKLQNKVAAAKSKRRYLNHLKMEATNPEEQRICVICREDFEVGALTVCGHQYCKECIRLWWKQNHSCPICKRRLVLADIHEITYKPQELTIRTEDIHTRDDTSSSKLSQKSAIYSEIDKTKLLEIKNVELDGPSFTTKVDTLVRHLIWLRESDPGSKSIIFSQFKEFLQVLAGAFKRHRIEFSSIDKPDGIERFKHDPAVECFLLHAKAHSSGLNLVNASHVFLCEPLLNTGLELQAIARVDRIGQHQETNVWLYLVDGTVEESIYQLSVKRRMEHIDQRLSQINIKGKQISNEISDTTLDEANSLELQQAPLASLVAKGDSGGEIIQEEDLWDCLFGGIEKRNASRALIDHELGRDEEVRRHLRAEAAEGRANAIGN
jgi:E3 ubiquitin-protein ligase SHPRH